MKKTVLVFLALAAASSPRNLRARHAGTDAGRRGIGDLEFSPDRAASSSPSPSRSRARRASATSGCSSSPSGRVASSPFRRRATAPALVARRPLARVPLRPRRRRAALSAVDGRRRGREAHRSQGGVSAFRWSPDGRHIALLMAEAEVRRAAAAREGQRRRARGGERRSPAAHLDVDVDVACDQAGHDGAVPHRPDRIRARRRPPDRRGVSRSPTTISSTRRSSRSI